ncbi:hypothetical protein FJZ33_09585, partial [Candidatus Poribacteria bacterium]|nr:hypothetical protein [Candidatus Poribacteria bacterium]
MRKLKIALWITAFVICAFIINSQSIALTASNLSIYPNPFSPGVHPYVEISFVLSEKPENNDQVKLTLDGDIYKDFAAGLNVRKIDKSFSDGIYDVNLSIDSTIALYGKLIVDGKPPEITNVSITPNYFSPNGDGINDYVEVKFNVAHTPTENDYLGNVVVVDAGPPIV